jgi:hypothetical protein
MRDERFTFSISISFYSNLLLILALEYLLVPLIFETIKKSHIGCEMAMVSIIIDPFLKKHRNACMRFIFFVEKTQLSCLMFTPDLLLWLCTAVTSPHLISCVPPHCTIAHVNPLFQISGTTFLLFFRWRKTNIAHGLSSFVFMLAHIEFYIILFPLRTRHNPQISQVLNMSSGPPLTPPSFNGYILQSPLTCWPPS